MGRKHPIVARADSKRVARGGEFNGVATVASRIVSYPGRIDDRFPFRICGLKHGEEDRSVEIHLTKDEARKLAADIQELL